MMRAAAARGDAEPLYQGQALLGEPLWAPSAPAGFADNEAAWIDGMGRRLDIANNFADRIGRSIDPDECARQRARAARVGRHAPGHRPR